MKCYYSRLMLSYPEAAVPEAAVENSQVAVILLVI
jgi:hypothetical protein